MRGLLSTFCHLLAWLVLLAALFVPLERSFALHPRTARRRGTVRDLGYYVLSGLLPALVLAVPASLLATAVRGWTPAAWSQGIAALPAGLRVALTLLVGEVGAYAGHRLAHRWAWLWRFHSVHHAATELDWLVHTRAHPVDLVFVRLCALSPVFMLGLARPSGLGVDTAAGLQVLTTVWGFLIHANLRWRLGPLEQVLASPAFHHWHHVRHGPRDRNFAGLLPVLDRLFGTLYLPAGWPPAYGVEAEAPPRHGAAPAAVEPAAASSQRRDSVPDPAHP